MKKPQSDTKEKWAEKGGGGDLVTEGCQLNDLYLQVHDRSAVAGCSTPLPTSEGTVDLWTSNSLSVHLLQESNKNRGNQT